jgi:hypothetical protein
MEVQELSQAKTDVKGIPTIIKTVVAKPALALGNEDQLVQGLAVSASRSSETSSSRGW